MKVIHKRYGTGTATKLQGTGVEVTFDSNVWPHFGKPIFCDVRDVEEVKEEEPQDEVSHGR